MIRVFPDVSYRSLFRFNFKAISTFGGARNDLAAMKALTPKQLGKIAIDVSKCANSDIKVWDTFTKSSSIAMGSFDFKDTLRILRGLGTFYSYLDYGLREADEPFLEKTMERLFECCDSYNCRELAEIAEMVSNLMASRDLTSPLKLFAKIALSFKIRLAEAVPADIVKLMVSFSKVGICDKPLIDTLVQIALTNDNFTPEELRNLATSCVLLDYCDGKLLDKLCSIYEKDKEMSFNDLGILSFIFTKSSYRNQRVLRMLERHLESAIKLKDSDLASTLSSLDVPNFCINLHLIGLKVPQELISPIDLKRLETNLFIDLLDLLVNFKDKQIDILEKCSQIKLSFDHKIKIFQFLTCAEFTPATHQLFKLVVLEDPNLLNHLKSLSSLVKLPASWLVELDFGKFNLENEETRPHLILLHTTLLSFLRYFAEDTQLRSATIQILESNLSKILKNNQNSIPHSLPSIITQERDKPMPQILVKEIEKMIESDIKAVQLLDGLEIPVIEGTNESLLFIAPEELLKVDLGEPQYRWIPKDTVPKAHLLSKMFWISQAGYNLTPISFYHWNLQSREDKLKYLGDVVPTHHTRQLV